MFRWLIWDRISISLPNSFLCCSSIVMHLFTATSASLLLSLDSPVHLSVASRTDDVLLVEPVRGLLQFSLGEDLERSALLRFHLLEQQQAAVLPEILLLDPA